jgi:signal transduction histidine kinase
MDDLQRLGKWVVKVPPTNPDQERLACLVAAMSAAMLPVPVMVAIGGLLSSTPTLFISVILLIALLLTHVLNRRGQYNAAVSGLLGVVIFMPVAVLFVQGKAPALLAVTAMVASTSVVLTNAFFPGHNRGLATGFIAAAVYLVLPVIHPDYALADVVYPAIGLITLGLMTGAYEHYRSALEIDRRAKLETENKTLLESEAALTQANQKLEQQLKDSAIELDATVYEFLRAKEQTERAKEEAERANVVKSAFLASMSHELRTPLNAIINFTKFVAKGTMGPVNEEQAETLYEVIDSAKHLLSLINDVLDMSKIESGSLRLFVENDVELKPILDSVIATGKGLLVEKPVTLETDIAAELPAIRGDRQRILQILLNVVSNACKFTEKGHIKLQAFRTENEVVFAVEDTGPGIDAEDRAAVFEAFKQTEAGLRQIGGTGLGMPITKNLVEAHGGRIWLESEVGTGTTFYVALPVESESLEPTLVGKVGAA